MFFFHPRAGCFGVSGPGVCSGDLGGLWGLGENRRSIERLVWQDPNHRTPPGSGDVWLSSWDSPREGGPALGGICKMGIMTS